MSRTFTKHVYNEIICSEPETDQHGRQIKKDEVAQKLGEVHFRIESDVMPRSDIIEQIMNLCEQLGHEVREAKR